MLMRGQAIEPRSAIKGDLFAGESQAPKITSLGDPLGKISQRYRTLRHWRTKLISLPHSCLLSFESSPSAYPINAYAKREGLSAVSL